MTRTAVIATLTVDDSLIAANAEKHHTADFSSGLVLRRGFAFDITVSTGLATTWPPPVLSWRATASCHSGMSSSSTSFECPSLPATAVGPMGDTASWGVVPKSEKELTLCIPPDAPVGRYAFTLEARAVSGDLATNHKVPLRAIILFNPWAEKDTVFLADEAARNEYVLNEEGTLYTGSAWYVKKKAWAYDQFEPEIVDTVLDAFLKTVRRTELSDPVLLSRRASAWINGNDEGGLMIGNWSGQYAPFTSPNAWTNSLKVFRAWVLSGPVKFGQCFTFAATLCTLMRLLGVPCRPVSNYWSAHDGGFDRAIDKFFEADGSKSAATEDSIWTFHVWNDVWMRRPDLGSSKYDGWQAIDATHQELSGGLWQMGPAPVAAVFEGNGKLAYDCEFVIGEVNADEQTWTRGKDGEWHLTKVDKTKIGPFLLTQSVGSTNGETLKLEGNMSNSKLTDTLDVMPLYKPKEGVLAERATLRNSSVPSGPVTFSTSTRGHHLGETVGFEVFANNAEGQFHLEIYSAGYHGRAGVKLAQADGFGATLSLNVTADEYKATLADTSCAFECRAFATSGEQHFAEVVPVDLAVPEFVVSSDFEIAGGARQVIVSWTNPCAFSLGLAQLSAAATRGVEVEITAGGGQEIAAHATATFDIVLRRAKKVAGTKQTKVVLELDTEVLKDVSGSLIVEVA